MKLKIPNIFKGLEHSKAGHAFVLGVSRDVSQIVLAPSNLLNKVADRVATPVPFYDSYLFIGILAVGGLYLASKYIETA